MEAREDEVLILAATRPAMMPLIGLPHGLATLFFVVGMETIIITKSVFYPLWLVPVWAVLYMIVRKDHNAIRIIRLWLRGSALSLDVWRWSGGSLSPWPLTKQQSFRLWVFQRWGLFPPASRGLNV